MSTHLIRDQTPFLLVIYFLIFCPLSAFGSSCWFFNFGPLQNYFLKKRRFTCLLLNFVKSHFTGTVLWINVNNYEYRQSWRLYNMCAFSRVVSFVIFLYSTSFILRSPFTCIFLSWFVDSYQSSTPSCDNLYTPFMSHCILSFEKWPVGLISLC
jgi:hypothetical protein